MMIESLPYLFGAIGGLIPFFEEIFKRGEVKIINEHKVFFVSYFTLPNYPAQFSEGKELIPA
jgi:hypothetical protein